MRHPLVSRGTAAAIVMSQVPAVPALLGAAIPGRRGASLEAVLVMALLAASAIILGRVREPVPRAHPLPVAVAVALAVAIAGFDLWIARTGVRSAVSGEPYTSLAFAEVLVAGPIFEEIVYRGLLWRALERRGTGVAATLAVTSLAFGVYHFAYWIGRGVTTGPALVHVLTASLAGAVLGCVRRWGGRVSLPALLHCAMNSTVLAARIIRLT